MNSPSLIKDLYLHIPFCTGKCAYCAFHSGLPLSHPETYIDTLIERSQPYLASLAPLQTIYCGGGTPGLLGIKGFQRLKNAPFMIFEKDYEWTVELHPSTCTPILLETLATLGVNRISIGVQSFHDVTLLACNRRHTAQQARDAIALARTFIPDTGIDLIAGLPGIDEILWQRTLEDTIALDLPHLSVYGLSIDEGSRWHREGHPSPDPDLLCDMLAITAEKLTHAGFERYETSNYAKPGHRCKHNLNTWHGGDYLGLGDGAASRLGRQRLNGFGQTTVLTPLDDALERALTHLRLCDGFPLDTLLARFPLLEPYREAWKKILKEFERYGLLSTIGAPTTRGYEVLDAITRAFYFEGEAFQ